MQQCYYLFVYGTNKSSLFVGAVLHHLCISLYSSRYVWQQRVSAQKVKMHLFLRCVVLCIQKFCNLLAPRFTTVNGQTTLQRGKRLNNMAGLNT